VGQIKSFGGPYVLHACSRGSKSVILILWLLEIFINILEQGPFFFNSFHSTKHPSLEIQLFLKIKISHEGKPEKCNRPGVTNGLNGPNVTFICKKVTLVGDISNTS